LRALVDKVPAIDSPLGTFEAAWELLGRVEVVAPGVFELMLMHPYTGSWLAYTNKLVSQQINGVCPLWIHLGYFNCLAAAGAARARIPFESRIPVWNGEAILPTLGMARFSTASTVATVRGDGSAVELTAGDERVQVADDAPSWWALRQVTTRGGLSVRLDDLDLYRGLNEPIPAKRIEPEEAKLWEELLDDAWRLIEICLPEFAMGLAEGMSSLVPRPPIAFRNMSGSTGNAFGSAIISRPRDAASLASILVHEFNHIRLYGLLRLVPLHDADSRERFRTLWRDDPRPIGGVLHGVYSFFGVTAFWRAFTEKHPDNRHALFEFAYWRSGVWDTLQALRDDPSLTSTGRRFVDLIADELGPWQDEPVAPDIARQAEVAAIDHYAGWRLRHVRPSERVVHELAKSWLADKNFAGTLVLPAEAVPVSAADGTWPGARLDLIRLGLAEPDRSQLPRLWPTVPGAVAADVAYVCGDLPDAIRGYKAELEQDPSNASAWIGLGLALSAQDASAGHVLLRHPELVRATHRMISRTATAPAPDDLAGWIARFVS
jgi:HEXXH motif-containing protein